MTTAALLLAASFFAMACVVLSMLLCTWRLMIGPSAQDRVLALDTLWMCTMLLVLLLVYSLLIVLLRRQFASNALEAVSNSEHALAVPINSTSGEKTDTGSSNPFT